MSKSQPSQRPISIGLAPTQEQGARMIGPISITFTGASINTTGNTNVVTDDLAIELENGTINNIQSVFFDSSGCPIPVALTFNDTQQTIVFPPKSQGYIPVLATNSMSYSAVGYGGGAVAGATYNIDVSFLNTPCEAQIWSTLPGSMLCQTSVNAGNTALLATPNNGGVPFSNPQGRDLYIYGFDITGTGATAEGSITATLTNIATANYAGASGSLSWQFDVPVLGAGSVNFTRRFDPPLRVTRAVNGSPSTPALSVPAMGAGQTAAGIALYYTVG